MELSTFEWLLTTDGQRMIAAATASDLSENSQLQVLTQLRRGATIARATAAYDLARVRQRAASKFAHAADMYFTREAFEQASGEIIAQQRATRYQGYGQVADLACGIGGDTIGLAHAANVVAVDRDRLRLAMARENARVCDVGDRVQFVEADLEHDAIPPADALFFDPARRRDGRRVFALDEYQPSLTLIARWRKRTPAIGVKMAPGIHDDDVVALAADEVEFVSVDGELKEAVLWFGPLATPGRRATLLTHANARGALTMHAPTVQTTIGVAAPRAYLYEPDPAIIRAHLVAEVATQISATQLDESIAYLSADHNVATPWARCWRVIEWLPFNLKRLRVRLRALGAGAITVKKRGSPLDTDTLAKLLSGDGTRPLVVVLTKLRAKPIVLICEGPVKA